MKTITPGGFFMRTMVAAAVACLSIITFSHADEARASIKKTISIPAQELVPALQALSQGQGIHLVYLAEDVRGRRSSGAVGTLTLDEALKKILSGTGLTYRYIDEQTVSILPIAIGPRRSPVPAGSGRAIKSTTLNESQAPEVAPDAGPLWRRFRVAQQSDPSDTQQSGTRKGESASQGAPAFEEVIVTAQKREERLKDIPISISVVSGDDIDRSSISSASEVLRRVPGVALMDTATSGSAISISVRGVGASRPVFDGSSPVGYYLDGVPMQQIRNAAVPDPNPYDLERVEVLRGPQGTLYGASAEGGLVRILTHDADLDDFEFKMRASVSSTERSDDTGYRGDAAINVPLIPGKLAARAVVGYQSAAGWIDQPNERDINDGRVRNYRLKLKAQPTDAFSIGLSGWGLRDQRGASSTSPLVGETTPSVLNDQPLKMDFDAYGVTVGYDFASVSVSSMTSYVDYAVQTLTDLNATPPGNPRLVYHYDAFSETFSQEVVINSTFEGPWRWTAGAYYRDTEDRYHEWIPLLGTSFDFDVPDTATTYAVFGELSRRFSGDRLEWTLGLRSVRDEFTSGQNSVLQAGQSSLYRVEDDASSTMPRAVLTWYPSRDVTVYGSYSQGFRSDVPQPFVTALTAARVGLTLSPVDADKLNNYEVGAKTDLLNGRLSLDAAAYYMDWKDVQQVFCIPFPTGVPGCPTALANAGSATGPGVDLGVTSRPVEGLELGLTASWNDLTLEETVFSTNGLLLFTEGERLSRSPEWTMGGSIDCAFPFGGSGFTGSFSASANYTAEQIGRQFAGAGVTVVPGEDMLLARASFALESPNNRWRAMLFADNLTDWDGEAGVHFSTARWIPRVRPRTVGLQVDYNFGQ